MPNWIRRRLPVRREEWPAVLWAFFWFFSLMAGYMILRPIRESFGAELGSQQVNRLFVAVFLTMLAIVPVFGKLVTVVRRRILMHLVYHFFALNLVLFAMLANTPGEAASQWLERIFFVWVSVFNLFVVSLFWSVLADLFSPRQAKRLFGPVAAGATSGAIAGSAFTSVAAASCSVSTLLLVAAALLELALLLAGGLQRATCNWPRQRHEQEPRGGIWAGVALVVRSRYLLMICLYLAFTSACGATVYLQMADYVGQHIPDTTEKTRYFATINFAVQAGTLLMQLWVVGVVMRRLGLSVALVMLPLTYAVCFIWLGLSQSLVVFAVVDVLRRILVYGISVPAREVLFTVVNREARYKSKNFIDTVVFRGSDAASSTVFVQLQKFLPAGFINFAVLPLAGLWVATGWWLGYRQERLQQRAAAAPVTAGTPAESNANSVD
jgi:AAA family ATP:ADP antiporter